MNKLSNIPETMYRAFTEERYARAFVERGKLRLRRLDLYRDIEDGCRRDASEGMGSYVDNRGHQWDFEMGNSIYVLCCSDAQVDVRFLREKFGAYIVRINDSASLAHDMERFMNASGMRTFNGVHGRRVDYRKGAVTTQEFDSMQLAILSITQKPARFAPESEYRFFTILSNAIPSGTGKRFLDINIGHRLRYAELVE